MATSMMKDEDDSYLKPGQKDENDSYVGRPKPIKPIPMPMPKPGMKSGNTPKPGMGKMMPKSGMKGGRTSNPAGKLLALKQAMMKAKKK